MVLVLKFESCRGLVGGGEASEARYVLSWLELLAGGCYPAE